MASWHYKVWPSDHILPIFDLDCAPHGDDGWGSGGAGGAGACTFVLAQKGGKRLRRSIEKYQSLPTFPGTVCVTKHISSASAERSRACFLETKFWSLWVLRVCGGGGGDVVGVLFSRIMGVSELHNCF